MNVKFCPYCGTVTARIIEVVVFGKEDEIFDEQPEEGCEKKVVCTCDKCGVIFNTFPDTVNTFGV